MKLKIGTYNICHCADFSNQKANESDVESRNIVNIEKTAKTIMSLNCDVIGLNEVFESGNKGKEEWIKQTEKLAKLAGYPYFYYAQGFDYVWTDIGNAILSKYPIENIKTAIIPTVPKEERVEDTWYEQRVLIIADVIIEGVPLKFIVTHFGLAKIEQERIVSKICEVIDNSKYPAFLLGDFNATPNQPILNELYNRLKSCTKETNNDEFTFSTYKPEIQIDYIFVPKTARVISSTVHNVRNSDHFPLTTEIELY